MSRFIETIQIKDKKLQKLQYHNLRFNNTRKSFYQSEPINLEEFITIPDSITNDVYRCRVSYGEEIETIEFFPYQPKSINTLKIVEYNDIDYSYKYGDRSVLNMLFEKRGECDDILIVKNGFISDTSSANVIFYDGHQWFTPSTPLLKGTKRAQLLAEGKIKELDIKPSDLKNFTHLRLTNALLDEGKMITIASVIF